MSASISLGRIFGIPIRLHITFLLIFPLFVYIFSDPPNQNEIFGIVLSFKDLGVATWVKYVFGTIASVLFFMAILGHELAHSYLAQKYGVKIRHITLMIFGGVSAMEETPRNPGQEWRMAFAGPLSSLAIGAVSFLAMIVLEFAGTNSVISDGVSILLGITGFYNILLAAFNLIPAFPMDGGRLLRSYFATRMPYVDATRYAAKIGRYFAIGMGLFGLITFNFFFIIIALFVYIGATEEEQATAITESLQGLTVRQLMTHDVQVVHPETTIQQLHELMLATRHMGFPVVDRGLVGIVTLTDTHKVPKEQLPHARVKDIMTCEVVTVSPDVDAAKALHLMTEKRISRLVVLENGLLVGIISQKDFLRAINIMTARGRGAQWSYSYTLQPPQGPIPPPSPPTASS